MWSTSRSEGWLGFAASMYSRTFAAPPLSIATLTTSKPWPWYSSRSSRHTGRSDRQLHHEAQACRKTFRPRSDDSRKSRPSRSGSSKSGASALASARPPDSGPSAQIPAASSRTMAMPMRSANAAASTIPSRSGAGTQRAPRQRPSGFASHPVARANRSGATRTEVPSKTAIATVSRQVLPEEREHLLPSLHGRLHAVHRAVVIEEAVTRAVEAVELVGLAMLLELGLVLIDLLRRRRLVFVAEEAEERRRQILREIDRRDRQLGRELLGCHDDTAAPAVDRRVEALHPRAHAHGVPTARAGADEPDLPVACRQRAQPRAR